MFGLIKRHPVKTIIIGLLLALIGSILEYFVFWSPDSIDHLFDSDGKLPLVIAHRGASEAAPANTLAAFERAIQMGADAIEFDVQLSADGEAVLIHDFTVDRTTNGTGNVAGLTLAQLKELDAGSWFGYGCCYRRHDAIRGDTTSGHKSL